MNIHTLRKAERRDLPSIVVLMEAHALYEKADFTCSGKLEHWSNAFFEEPVKVQCFVVEVAEEIMGYFTYTFDFSTWDADYYLHLDCLYLKKELRGQGIGAEILKFIRERALENKCVNVQWQTPTFNEPAIRFYKKNGALGKDKIRFFL